MGEGESSPRSLSKASQTAHLCSSFLRLMHMARWKPWAMHTLWRLHFTFWQGSLVVSRAAGTQSELRSAGSQCQRSRETPPHC